MARHIHADKIIEAANDTSIEWQFKSDNKQWIDCSSRLPEFMKDREYRKKPRELKEGEWYPCIDGEGDHAVLICRGGRMQFWDNTDCSEYLHDELKIGESLGKIDFPK